MENVQVLDCTLRDGGYLLDKKFGDKNIHGIVDGLIETRIDIIEIGFLQNDGFGEGKTVFLNSKDAEAYIPLERNKSIFTAFADCSRYDINNLDDRTGRSFDAVRECFYKWEQDDAIENCKKINEKGYLCFVQPVDVLGYTDKELIELIEKINMVEVYCFSIVDTFGSMYEDDLNRIFSLVHNNLRPDCKIGFHSHNNLQMSSALSQKFISLAQGKREIIVDTTISGMGRGAGNTPTELITQYLIEKFHASYEMDALLDVIDNYMRNIRSQAEWGYNTDFYLAGVYSAHVNNISYLLKKNSIRAKDLRYILNKVDIKKRKRYDYDLLDQIYCDYVETDIDDSLAIRDLKEMLSHKKIAVIAAGKSVDEEQEKINQYIEDQNAIVISINGLYKDVKTDFIYISNAKRYKSWNYDLSSTPCIMTSNIKTVADKDYEFIVSLRRLIKCGWENMDNSLILLLRLLNELDVESIGIAGFDGYELNHNYAIESMEYHITTNDVIRINSELEDMFVDFLKNKKKELKVEFITKSRFERWVD